MKKTTYPQGHILEVNTIKITLHMRGHNQQYQQRPEDRYSFGIIIRHFSCLSTYCALCSWLYPTAEPLCQTQATLVIAKKPPLIAQWAVLLLRPGNALQLGPCF